MSNHDTRIINAIVGHASVPSEEEAQATIDATTADDYDDWILDALNARAEGRIQFDGHGRHVEHPTTRVFRLGIESIREKRSSPLFLDLLEQIAKRAETHDVLHQTFPDTFISPIKSAQMTATTEHRMIANDFREFVKKWSDRPFSETKEQFKINKQMEQAPIHPKTIDRALEAHGLNWKGKPGTKPKPGSKRKQK